MFCFLTLRLQSPNEFPIVVYFPPSSGEPGKLDRVFLLCLRDPMRSMPPQQMSISKIRRISRRVLDSIFKILLTG